MIFSIANPILRLKSLAFNIFAQQKACPEFHTGNQKIAQGHLIRTKSLPNGAHLSLMMQRGMIAQRTKQYHK